MERLPRHKEKSPAKESLRKIAGPKQLGFQIGEDGSFHLPTLDILTLPEIKFFLDWINQRKLLGELTSDKTLLVDLRHNQTVITEEKNWSPQTPFDRVHLKPHFLSAVAIIMPPLTDRSLEDFGRRITKAVKYLHPHHGAVFIAEEKGENTDTKARQQLLKKAGLAKVSVLKPKKYPFFLWEGRLAKEHPAVDLTTKEDFWKTLKIVCNGYQSAGFEVIFTPKNRPATWLNFNEYLAGIKSNLPESSENYRLPEIVSRCQQTKNPPQAALDLINGLGVTIRKTSCGICSWEVGFHGESKFASCDDPACEDLSPNESLKLPVNFKVGSQFLHPCPDCGSFWEDPEHPGNYLTDGPPVIKKITVVKRGVLGSQLFVETFCKQGCFHEENVVWALNAETQF